MCMGMRRRTAASITPPQNTPDMEEEATEQEQQQQQEEEEEQRRPADQQLPSSCSRGQYLPQELVEPILRRSSLWSSTRLQLVCRAWAAAGREAAASHRAPWMFLYTVDHAVGPETSPTTGYMASICGDGAFFKLDTLHAGHPAGSCDGWLAFGGVPGRRLPSLLNPFTMARVDLPPLPSELGRNINSCVAFYLFPYGAPAARGCCVMASHPEGVAMWKPGQEDWEWWQIGGWNRVCIRSVAAVNGELYVLRRAGESVYTIDFAARALAPLSAPGLPPPSSRGCRQLVESRGELLLVHCTRAELKGVYRLDAARKEWMELRSLGEDRALFVGSTSQEVLFGCPSAMSVERAAGCRGDCVYLMTAGTGARWTVFDMARGGAPETLESSPPPGSRPVGRTTLCRAVWVSPNLGRD